jgi:putative transposon-encoded protein
VTTGKTTKNDKELTSMEILQGKVKFEVYGQEMLEKEVKLSGNSGRVYLPPDWVGHQVKIIRVS